MGLMKMKSYSNLRKERKIDFDKLRLRNGKRNPEKEKRLKKKKLKLSKNQKSLQ